jgi:catechol-2,3-dioxygenase
MMLLKGNHPLSVVLCLLLCAQLHSTEQRCIAADSDDDRDTANRLADQITFHHTDDISGSALEAQLAQIDKGSGESTTTNFPSWLQRPEKVVTTATELSFIILNRTDMEAAKEFFIGFGLKIVTEKKGKSCYLRAHDTTHHAVVLQKADNDAFVGIGFSVKERRHVHDLVKHVPGAVLHKRPVGGGESVTMQGPDGVIVEVRYDMEEGPDEEADVKRMLNFVAEHTRRVNSRQWVASMDSATEPPKAWRLGHVILRTRRIAETANWYQKTLGLVVSDCESLPGDTSGIPARIYLRTATEEGMTTDHHALVLSSMAMLPDITPSTGVSVAEVAGAFEMQDIDAIGVGHRLLGQLGFKHVWGLGRRVLGM